MNIFVDTSAFYALLDSSDRRHAEAARIWNRLLESTDAVFTHNYIVVETAALVQRRLGAKAVNAFLEDILAVVGIHWIDEDLHGRAAGTFRAANRKSLSLVDCASFEVMRARVSRTAFAFDNDFETLGFALLDS